MAYKKCGYLFSKRRKNKSNVTWYLGTRYKRALVDWSF